MKSVIIGILLMIVVAAIAWGVLQTQQTTSADAFRTPSTSLNEN